MGHCFDIKVYFDTIDHAVMLNAPAQDDNEAVIHCRSQAGIEMLLEAFMTQALGQNSAWATKNLGALGMGLVLGSRPLALAVSTKLIVQWHYTGYV